MGKRPSIEELEAILQREDEVEIEILPNGEVRAKDQTTSAERGGRKPLTMREDLGGEYSAEELPSTYCAYELIFKGNCSAPC